jgi:hypothetical protein
VKLSDAAAVAQGSHDARAPHLLALSHGRAGGCIRRVSGRRSHALHPLDVSGADAMILQTH